MSKAKNKDSDQQAHLRGLISVFVCCQEGMNNTQSYLSLTWSHNTEGRFSYDAAQMG